MKIKLNTEILNWLKAQPLKTQRSDIALTQQDEKGIYFSVIAGVRADFKELKIHLARYPKYFTSMTYAQSEVFSLEQLFEDSFTRAQKIQYLGEILKSVSIEAPYEAGSSCIPYVLIVEEENSDEEFYHTESFSCGLSGTNEKIIEKVYIGIEHDSCRHEMIAFGSENVIVISVDDSDPGAIEAIGLTNSFKSAAFGHVTYFKKRTEISHKLSDTSLTITSKDAKDKRWMLDGNFIW